MSEHFDQEGKLTKRVTVAAVPNCNVKLAQMYRRYLLAWAKEMGLTLRARQAIRAPEAPAKAAGLLEQLMADDPIEPKRLQ